MNKPILKFVQIIALYAALLMAIIVIGPPSTSLAKLKLDPTTVKYRTVDSNKFSFRFETQSPDGTQDQQFHSRQRKGVERRFLYTFEDSYPFEIARSVFVPSAGGTINMLVNGGILRQSDKNALWTPSFGQDKILVDIPRHVMLPGRNRIDIYLVNDANRTGLGPIYLGSTESIKAAAKSHMTWQTRLPVFVFFSAFIGIFICAAGIFVGTFKARYVSLGLLSCVLCAQALLSLPQLYIFFEPYDFALRLAFPVILVVLTAATTKSFEHFRNLSIGSTLSLLAFTGPILALLTLLSPLYVSSYWPAAILCLLGAVPLIWVCGGQSLIIDLAARKSRLGALEDTITAQSAELDEKTKVIMSEMRQRALLEERNRFTRDIHDGIGGQFLSLLLRVRSGAVAHTDIAEELQAGLHDLRLVVDSLDNMNEDLTDALTTFRERITPQLRAAKIDLNWHQPQQLSAILREAGGILNLYRILQEAFTNIVRHSKASDVHLSVVQNDDTHTVDICIDDNGVGFDEAKVSQAGKGLANMKKRSEALGAELDFLRKKSGGMRLTLSIPLETISAPELL